MSKRDYTAAVADTLLALVNEAISEGPDAVNDLHYALAAYSRKVRETYEGMPWDGSFRCFDCGKYWTAPMTVQRANDARPDNCPACFNATSKRGQPSGWTDCFRYVDRPEGE
jgi:hypothetical protein